LFVAGSSVFPTGGDANPTLTIIALAIRLADQVKKVMASDPATTVNGQLLPTSSSMQKD
jgi:choline dehydrogenase-like flavoprotein